VIIDEGLMAEVTKRPAFCRWWRGPHYYRRRRPCGNELGL